MCIFVYNNKNFLLTKNNPLIRVKKSSQSNRHFFRLTQRTVLLSKILYKSTLIKLKVSGGLKCFHITIIQRMSQLFTQQKEELLTSRVQGVCPRNRGQSPLDSSIKTGAPGGEVCWLV